MAKKTKAKNGKKSTKEEKINFDEEMIIGLRKIDIQEDKPQSKKGKKSNKKGKSKKAKQNKENEKSKKNKEQDGITDIPQIGEEKKKRKKGKTIQKRKVQEKLTPKQELARKKRKVILRITKWFTLFAIIIGTTICTLLSPIFNIKKIDVIGNSKISSDEIISLSEMQIEQNMFTYRNRDIIRKIKSDAYIDTVKIMRKIPDTIEVSVTERKASFMIQIANAYAYISSQGYILEISSQKLNLPILTGFETKQEDIQVGNRLCTKDLKRLEDVLKIMEAAISNRLTEFIDTIDISHNDDYILTMQAKKKTVYLGDTSNLSTKMLWILTFNEEEGNTPGDIMLNMNLNDEKNKPVFRKKI